MYCFSEDVVSAQMLTRKQINALWILADGKGHSNREISKQLKPERGKNKSLSESQCHRDVIDPLRDKKLLFTQKRKGRNTDTGRHEEVAYFIKQSALQSVCEVLMEVWINKHEHFLSDREAYIKGDLSPDLKSKFEEATNKFHILAVLKKEVDEYRHSIQFIADRDPRLVLLHPEESGFRNGHLPPNENYFILGKDVPYENLSLQYPLKWD